MAYLCHRGTTAQYRETAIKTLEIKTLEIQWQAFFATCDCSMQDRCRYLLSFETAIIKRLEMHLQAFFMQLVIAARRIVAYILVVMCSSFHDAVGSSIPSSLLYHHHYGRCVV